jgi:hypothetical protein
MLEEGADRTRGRQVPDLIGDEDEVEVVAIRRRERLQAARDLLEGFRKDVEKTEGRPGKREGRDRPEDRVCDCDPGFLERASPGR